MLFRQEVIAAIAAGEVTVAFRAWKRPTVRAGGTLITAAGQLAIDEVSVIDPAQITDADARRAGAADAAAIRAMLRTGEGRQVYRVAFHLLGEDPRVALREQADLDGDELAALVAKLAAMDARSPIGPWTAATLEAIAAHPATVSTVLAEALGQDRQELKVRIRRLKALGLTESLGTGYRLSPRGEVVLAALG